MGRSTLRGLRALATGPVGVITALKRVHGLLALALLLCACAPPVSGPSIAVEFVYERSGGLCATPDGAGAMCSLRVTVRDDGTWSAEGVPTPDPASGSVPIGAASELAGILEGRWTALTREPFEGVCPTAYDGSEIAYIVRRTPTGPDAANRDAEVREVRSCTYDLTHSDAEYSVQLVTEAWTQLDLPE